MAARKSYAARADEPGDEPRVTRRRVAAAAAQLGGWVTTWLFVRAIGLDGLVGLGVSLVLEWVLFEFKSAVLTGEGRADIYGWAAIVVDTLLNAGGIWGLVLGLDNTETYAMVSKSLDLGQKMNMLPAMIIALVLGFVLAVAPHRLWHGGRRKE